MSSRTKLKNAWLGFAVEAFVLLGAGCAGGGTGGAVVGNGPAVQLPDCPSGQLLSTNPQGQIVCRDAPAGTIALPKCTANERLTADGKAFSCMPLACK